MGWQEYLQEKKVYQWVTIKNISKMKLKPGDIIKNTWNPYDGKQTDVKFSHYDEKGNAIVSDIKWTGLAWGINKKDVPFELD